MKKVLIFILFWALPLWLSAQIFTGKVYRAGTDSVIASASVYYSGSLNGTITNSEGVFELRMKSGQVPLIVSCVGYNSAIVNDYKAGDDLKVYLEPKQQQLKNVLVRFDGMTREEKERIFIQEFIGVSAYARSCTIKNLDDVDLTYSKETGALTASGTKPILIENKMLGYTLTYYLDNFIKAAGRVSYAGNFIFKDNIASQADNKKIRRNRENAYNGSYMQFIRALWHNKLNKYGFEIYKNYNYTNEVTPDSILLDSAGQKFVNFNGRVTIIHKSNRSLPTRLTTAGVAAYINKDGFSNAYLRWSGRMTAQRIGDMLPYEYRSAAELKEAGATEGILAEGPDGAPDAVTVTNPVKVPVSKNAKLFKSIVLIPNNGLDTRLVVKKWHCPIGYKIYGTTNNLADDKTIVRYIDKMFTRMAQLTGLNIFNADNDDKVVNLHIILGDIKQSMAPGIPAEALPYLHEKNGSGIYYETAEQGFSKMITQIATIKDVPVSAVWTYLRTLLLHTLGFFNSTSDKESIFYSNINFWNPSKEINPADAALVKTLYQPEVRSGMTGPELDQILKGLNL